MGHKSRSKSSISAIENSPGLLTFDFDTLTLTNSSNVANPQFQDQWIPSGCALNIPSFKDEFLIFIGGGSLGNYEDLEAGGVFNNITIYNKQKQEWYWQKVTGEIPDPREPFCTVGVSDDVNGTFEV